MKRLRRKFITAAVILSLVLTGIMPAFAADNNGIQVQYNGKVMALTNAAKNIEGRIMLPFREVFESMGAVVSYDAKTKIITAKKSDTEVSFTAGNPDLTIRKDGTVTTKKMDVAPFIDKKLSSTFVSVRSIAESLGYCVGWDATDKTVVIIDPATLFSNADSDFSIVGKLMKSELDPEKSYAATGRFDMDITTYASPGAILPGMDFSMSGTISGVQQKNNADMAMNLAFDFTKMLTALTAEEKAQMEPLLGMFQNVDMNIKMDGETGVTYMNSGVFSAIDPTAGKNTWYKMNVYDMYSDMGVDLKSLTGLGYNDAKLSELLTASLASMEYMETSTYQDTKTMYLFLKNLIGDEAFSKKTAGSFVTYSLTLNQASVLAALTKTALAEGITTEALNLTETGDLLNSSELASDIVIREKAGSLYDYRLKGSFALDDMNCVFDMGGDQKNAEGSITFDQKDVMKIYAKVESHVTETSRTPDLTLPPDAVILDYPIYPAY